MDETGFRIDVGRSHKVREFGEDILQELPGAEELSPQLATRIEKYIKGTNIQLDLHTQLQHDLQYTQAAEAARTARAKPTQRRVTGGGLMTVEEARTRIVDREEKEANAGAKRAQKRQKRAQLNSAVTGEGSRMQR
jgi:hypothetical protein